MRFGLALLAGVNAALLLSTATFAADMTIPVEDPVAGTTFTLSLGGGVVGMNVPDFDVPTAGTFGIVDAIGQFGESLTDDIYGGIIGGNITASLGSMGGYNTAIGLNAFIAGGSRSGSTSQTLTDDDEFLVIPGMTVPAGAIDLNVINPAAPTTAANSDTDDGIDQAGTTVNNAGDVNGYNVNPSESGDGFSYIGLASSVTEAFAFGAMATETGGIFIASGDLTDWTIDTDVTQDLIYAGADLTFSLSSDPSNGDVIVSGYAGPSYRFLGQTMTTSISVTPAVMGTAADGFAFPTYTQSTEEMLDSHYLGGVVGASFAIPVAPTAALTFGGEAGVYNVNTSYGADETYSVTGGGPTPVNESVTNTLAGLDMDDSEFAYALRGNTSFTTAVSQNMQLNFGLGVEYMSKVATVSRGALNTGVPSSDDYGNGTDGAAGQTVSIGYGDMFSWTATIGVSGQF